MEKQEKNTASPYELDGRPPLKVAIPLGLQHVLAMFVGNLTPLLIITAACGIEAGGDLQVALLQNAMLIAGIVTLVQVFTIGPVGGKLPIVMGTSSGFIGVCQSVAGVMGNGVVAYGSIMAACFIGGLFETVLGSFLKPLRKFFPSVVTGTVVLSIGLSLIGVGISSFGGGSSAKDYGSLENLFVGFVVLIVIIVKVIPQSIKNSQKNTKTEQSQEASEKKTKKKDKNIEQAKLLAMGYDYDGAINLLKSVKNYKENTKITKLIKKFEEQKAACVPVDVNAVPHIFYHSLINDTDRAFNVSVLGKNAVDGMNAWMTTVEEFDRITQQMYDNGYVFVRLRDLVVETKDENGNVTFAPNTNLMLPPDKKAVVLSVDDLSYYHSYKPAGFPERLVLDDNGDVKCLYKTSDGKKHIGDYDVVPRLNTFLKKHPDGAYKGARGMIAMTGYNGVFGYRTDSDYEVREHLKPDQLAWLNEHPDYNRRLKKQKKLLMH